MLCKSYILCLAMLIFGVRGVEASPLKSPEELKLGLCEYLIDHSIVASSAATKNIFDFLSKIPQVNSTVFITGETGVGKEVVAKAVHDLSDRRKKEFVAVNAGAISETLRHSELFGHEAGAFTGATKTRRGLFELANEGTIFLDEIQNLSLEDQAAILRVLQERKIRRLGGDRDIPVDVRVIVASNVDLRKEVSSGKFREDLFYRLDVLRVHVPPLRDRREDILPLAHAFILEFSKNFGLSAPPSLSVEAQQVLIRHPWDGNIRELKNAMERAVVAFYVERQRLAESSDGQTNIEIEVAHLGISDEPVALTHILPETSTTSPYPLPPPTHLSDRAQKIRSLHPEVLKTSSREDMILLMAGSRNIQEVMRLLDVPLSGYYELKQRHNISDGDIRSVGMALEREKIVFAMFQAEGVMMRAAVAVDMTRETLRRRLQRYEILPAEYGQ